MRSKILGPMALFFLLASGLWAGDVAEFSNLGFSDDSRLFFFGYYGVEESSPYVETFLVDVAANNFVKDGVFKKKYDFGQSGEGALYDALICQASVLKAKNINPVKTGRIVYLGDSPKNPLTFRDFKNKTAFTVTLNQEKKVEGKEPSAAFFITLDRVGPSGKKDSFTLGRRGYFRKGVKDYQILQVLFSPDESSLVIVIQKRMVNQDGVNIRYMVETIKL